MAAPPAAPAPAPPSQVPPQQVAQVLPPSLSRGQDVLAQTFAQMLAQSRDTVTVMTPLSPDVPGVAALPAAPMVAVADPEAFAAVERALGVAPMAARSPTAALAPMVATGAPETVRFAHDSAALNAEARARIAEIAARYKEVGGRVRVVGHASSYTRDMPVAEHMMANFRVSADRARAVADELMRQGVAPAALIVDAVGDSQPLVTEAMPAGQAANRRVEIFLGA